MTKGRDVPDAPLERYFTLNPRLLDTGPWDHHQFVVRNWLMLAALAWQGYQNDGRGMVIVMGNMANPQDCAYRPLTAASGASELRDATRLMRGYDPTTDVIVGFHDPASGKRVLLFLFSAAAPLVVPPEAWRQMTR